MKKILITGISGQDGIFLTNYLIRNNKDLKILGISRSDADKTIYKKLKYLGLKEFINIDTFNINLNDYDIVKQFISEQKPDAVYNFSGPSSVYESYIKAENKDLILNIFNNLIMSLIETNNFATFYQASSSEMFGNNSSHLNENSNFNPNSPYAEAKLVNHLKVKELYEKYDWKIFSGIMFNHESEFRENNYLIMKIIHSARNIKKGKENNLTLGSLDYVRDWSYVKDIVNSIYAITTNGSSPDYVIGSGKGHSIKEVVAYVFNHFELDWKKYVEIDKNLLRKGDPEKIVSNPKKLQNEFNLKSEYSFTQMLDKCILGFK